MLIGYARISKADGSQSLDLQRDALREAGVSDDALYQDQASGEREDRPGLAAFLKVSITLVNQPPRWRIYHGDRQEVDGLSTRRRHLCCSVESWRSFP